MIDMARTKDKQRVSGLQSRPDDAAPLSTIRSIDLDPEDWFWATWRPRTPLPRPDPTPFEPGRLPRALQPVNTGRERRDWTWNRAGSPRSCPAREAHFWLDAIAELMRRDLQPATFVKQLRARRKDFAGGITLQEAVKLTAPTAYPRRQILSLLSILFAARDLIAMRSGSASHLPD